MNRRRFLSALGLGLAALHLRLAPRIELPPTQWLAFQTPRTLTCYSADYLAALERILAGQPNDFLEQFKKSGFGA